jgi:hypothetical protein
MNCAVAVSNAAEPTTTSRSHDNAFEFSLALETRATTSDAQESTTKTRTGCGYVSGIKSKTVLRRLVRSLLVFSRQYKCIQIKTQKSINLSNVL